MKKSIVTRLGRTALDMGLDNLPDQVLWELMSFSRVNLPDIDDQEERQEGEKHTGTVLNRVRDYDPGFDVEDARVLDIGCGPGRILVPMARRGADAYGIDIAKGNLLSCKKYAREANVDVSLEQARDRIPFQEEFDLIYSINVFMRIQRHATISYMESAYEHLSDDGIVYFHVPNMEHEDNRKRIIEVAVNKRHSFRKRYFTRSEIETYLETIGYRDVEIREYTDALVGFAKR